MTAHPESEERLRALIDAFGVAAEQYGYSRKAYPRSAAAIHAENQRAESRRVLLDELARLRASLVEATRDRERLLTIQAHALTVHFNFTSGDEAFSVTDHGPEGMDSIAYHGATIGDAMDKYAAASLHTDTP